MATPKKKPVLLAEVRRSRGADEGRMLVVAVEELLVLLDGHDPETYRIEIIADTFNWVAQAVMI